MFLCIGFSSANKLFSIVLFCTIRKKKLSKKTYFSRWRTKAAVLLRIFVYICKFLNLESVENGSCESARSKAPCVNCYQCSSVCDREVTNCIVFFCPFFSLRCSFAGCVISHVFLKSFDHQANFRDQNIFEFVKLNIKFYSQNYVYNLLEYFLWEFSKYQTKCIWKLWKTSAFRRN